MGFPTHEVIKRQSSPSRSTPIQSGTMFAVGMADRGPTTEVAEARSLQQFVDKGGDRVTYGGLYDAADAFFHEGGSVFIWVRVVGGDAVKASKSIVNGAAENTLKAIAKNEGEWANNLKVVIVAGAVEGNYIVQIKESGTVVEESPEVVNNEAAVAWINEHSSYITLEDLAKGDPAAGEYALAGGDDDREAAVDADWQTALDAIGEGEGPGQITAPGRTTTATHKMLDEHADARGRVSIKDGADTATAATLLSAAATGRALTALADKGGLFGSWYEVPGVATGTLRAVPPSAIICGIIARNHSAGLSVNTAAAGDRYGQSQYAVGLTQTAFSDADKDALHDAGVNIAEMRNGVPTNMGFRTLVDGTTDDTWLLLTNVRLYMEIGAKADAIAARYQHENIDGKGITFAKLNGELRGMLMPYFAADALYGESFDEAAFVNTGSQVNTPQTIQGREIIAVIELRMSPFGENVKVYVSKVATTEAV